MGSCSPWGPGGWPGSQKPRSPHRHYCRYTRTHAHTQAGLRYTHEATSHIHTSVSHTHRGSHTHTAPATVDTPQDLSQDRRSPGLWESLSADQFHDCRPPASWPRAPLASHGQVGDVSVVLCPGAGGGRAWGSLPPPHSASRTPQAEPQSPFAWGEAQRHCGACSQRRGWGLNQGGRGAPWARPQRPIRAGKAAQGPTCAPEHQGCPLPGPAPAGPAGPRTLSKA